MPETNQASKKKGPPLGLLVTLLFLGVGAVAGLLVVAPFAIGHIVALGLDAAASVYWREWVQTYLATVFLVAAPATLAMLAIGAFDLAGRLIQVLSRLLLKSNRAP